MKEDIRSVRNDMYEDATRMIKQGLLLVVGYSTALIVGVALLVWLLHYSVPGAGEPQPKWLWVILQKFAEIAMPISFILYILGGGVFQLMAKGGDDATAIGIGTVIGANKYDRSLKK